MISQRPQQPLERAVAKALARKAELRAAKVQAEDDSGALESMTTSLSPAESAGAEGRHLRPVAELTESGPTNTSSAEASSVSLPAAAMNLIERLANRPLDEPVDAELEAGLGGIRLDSPEAKAKTEVEVDVKVEAKARPKAEPEPEAQPEPDSTAPTASAAKTESASNQAMDAFQLLLANNPEADDNSRSDLRDAPSLRNPRKALADTAPPETPAGTNAQPAAAAEAPSSNADDGHPENEQDSSERSLRNWFSPKQDPNPPPPPEQDPSRDH